MKKAILEALEARYNAQISEADATITIYLDKQVQKIADAQEKLKVLEDFQPERSVL